MKPLKLVLLALTLGAPALHANVISDFNSGIDGWKIGDISTLSATANDPTWFANSWIRSVESSYDNAFNAFAAPSKFLGDKSSYYGGTVEWLLSSDQNDGVSYPNLVLAGSAGTLYYVTAPPSTTDFTTNTVALNPTGGWLWNAYTNGTPTASEAQIQSVLADLTGFFISADWYTGNEIASLDNVQLLIPEPGAVAMIGITALALVALRLRNRRARD